MGSHRTHAHPKNHPNPPASPEWRRIDFVGLLALVTAVAASAALALHHWDALGLPGCGIGSPCDRAASSAFGTIPGLGWPVSVVGLVYFLGMAVAWLASKGRMATWLCAAATLGLAGSVGWVAAMISGKYACGYCLAVHGSNAVFVAAAWMGARGVTSPPRGLAAWHGSLACAVWLLAGGAGGLIEDASREAARRTQEANLARTTAALTQPAATVPATPPATESLAGAAPGGAGPVGIEGRFRTGPASAQARVVVFTDYQCPDCRKVEGELSTLLSANPTMSLSVRHFPLSTLCNSYIKEDVHPDACWGARAAEAAGLLGGNDAFWKVHHWMFERGGSFPEADLRAFVRTLGLDDARFVETMEGARVAEILKADMDEASQLGITNTPMIFVNGVEFKGWNAERGVTRAIAALLATNPLARTGEADAPIRGGDKIVEEWRTAPRVDLPPEVMRRTTGPEDSPVTVVLFGDYLEKNCADADGLIRLFTHGPGFAVRYAFQHYPVDQSCNTASPITQRPMSCLASRTVEAAAFTGGPAAFWDVHNWMMMNRDLFAQVATQTPPDPATGATIPPLEAINAELATPLDLAAWRETIANPAVNDIVAADGARAATLGIRAIPLIYVNGRPVTRWKIGTENLLPRIFDEAAKEAASQRTDK